MTITGTVTCTDTADDTDWNIGWTRTDTTTSYDLGTGTANATSVVTASDGTHTKLFTATGTITGTANSTQISILYYSRWAWSSTVSDVGTGTIPATVTATATATGSVGVSWTYTGTQTQTATQTTTGTQTRTGTQTATTTQSITDTQTATGTQTSTDTQTGTNTQTGTGTQTGTSTQTGTGTQTGTSTQTGLSNIICTVANATCTATTACPAVTSSICSTTGNPCTGNGDCPAVGSCKYTNIACPNPGGSCANATVCAHATSSTCVNPATDCPPLPGTGTCSPGGGTPSGGCKGNNDCPSYKTCSVTGDSCVHDTDCPLQTSGTCSGQPANNPCSRYRPCPNGQTCTYPGQTCTGTDNVCNLPQDSCVTKTDNTCNTANNQCNTPTNTCVFPPTYPNLCLQPVSPTDTCVESTNGKLGPIRMCILAQTVCKNDVDCKTAGDSCGPATSRAVIAKRAISSVVQNNNNVLNFGLMTFYEKGYFPYFLNTTANTGPVTVYESTDKLTSAHCLDRHWGPTNSCTIKGNNMTLRGSPNSRYHVRTTGNTWIDVDADYCGQICDLPGALGIGRFEGAYYQYTANSSGNSAAMIVRPTYSGQDITYNSQNYSYYKPLPNYYNGGAAPPLDFNDCGNSCSATCGGRWDTQLAPFLSTADDPTISQNAADAITQAMAPAANGGLVTYWSTPTGCTLQNSVSKTINTSAYDYMSAVKTGNATAGIPADHLPCRDNYILLITDGEANGPGDSNCSTAACAYDKTLNPNLTGCTCRAVLAANNLYQNLGVRTFVVGFSGDVASGSARTTNDNIARAGRTDAGGNDGVAPFAYLAQNEDQLNNALQLVIYDAVKGSYSTAPTSTSAGTQQATTVAEGRYALDSRMDFPEWKGHLLAYDLAGASPVLAWDSYQKLVAGNWWQRRVYTWNGTNMVKIQVDPTTHAVTNSAALATIGMGASPAEAAVVARWMLGDPTYGNPAILGAIVNSTPIDVASPGDSPEPGSHDFFLKYQNRPHLIYVGSSDGMLHAFFLVDTNIGGTVYPAGTEAFAFLPPDLMSVVRQQYAQGGQKPDPFAHIFGLADSPKAKSLCVQHCNDAATAVWKTLLIMPEGYGGGNTFMLDVTNPFSTTGLADPPINVQWHTGYGSSASTYNNLLGNTISLPAFFFNRTTNLDDYRVGFASGYPVTDGSTTQGRAIIVSSASTGGIISSNNVAPASTCSQEYTALTDFATARDFARGQDNKLLAGYFGDTSGQLFRYMADTGVTVDQAFTCDHPLHFSPTVVQLDRDATTTSYGHMIFPVQVTNSNLDLDTVGLPPSKMVFWKENVSTDSNGNVTSLVKDTNWAGVGQVTLTVGNNSEICGITQTDAHGVVTCQTAMPLGARPTATPLGVLLADASGFEVFTMWYVASPDGCTRGQTYLTLHRMYANGVAEQRAGILAAHEPVTSPVILGGRIYLFGSTGAIEITGLLPDSVSPGRAVPPNAGMGLFQRYNWSEILP